MPRYLTKSKFKLALDCPAKLFYTGKSEYVDNKLDNPFLAALAEGGFQVGELAKIYYEGGHFIDTLDHEKALQMTKELMQKEDIMIFEAAFLHGNYFIRADIVDKHGNSMDLIEVKAKSFDPKTDEFRSKNGKIKKEWQPYLFDIAFQYYVCMNALRGLKISPYLMLTDKSALASVEGLNQRFFLEQSGTRTKAVLAPGTSKESVGNTLLAKINVMDIVQSILNNEQSDIPFAEMVAQFAGHFVEEKLYPEKLGAHCGKCEFKATPEQMAEGKLSGFHDCWKREADFKPADFERPSILNIWDFRAKDSFIRGGIYFQEQLSPSDLGPKTPPKKNAPPIIGLTRPERRILQVEKSKTNDNSFFLDKASLRDEMAACVYPLHFIDFETTALAIPLNKGRRPYEQTAFQFSHHSIAKDGTIMHAGEWINMERGKFPNFEFVRALKMQLENDSGSIFRYATHENTILNAVYEQLRESGEKDRDELCGWIRTITHSKKDAAESWKGERDMIDLLEWVIRFYYSPRTNGSNSIKQILPAILTDSDLLMEKYRKPIYGNYIKSINFKKHAWITYDTNGNLINPYYTLPRIWEGIDNEAIDTICIDEESGIYDGGAAMTAYARMQFTQVGDAERAQITTALLRYCELDTLAMVMIWEAWADWCK